MPAVALRCIELYAAGERTEVAPSKPMFKARLLTEASTWDSASVLAFAPDGLALATGSWQGTVKLRDPATGKDLAPPAKHKDSVSSIAFSADGKFMASAGGSEFTPARNEGKTTGQVKLWDAVARKELGVDRRHVHTERYD